MGYVYLLMTVDEHGTEQYKIGQSKYHPNVRMSQLQTGNSNVISVINFYESYYYKKIEGWLHSKFGGQKTLADNEWFNLTNEQVGEFVNHCKDAESTIKFLLAENPFYK